MLCRLFAALVISGTFAVDGAFAADPTAKAIIDRAIEAGGGLEAIAKYKRPFYLECEGKFFGPNGDGEIKQRISKWLPDMIRAEYESATLDGKSTSQVRVFDGKVGRDKRRSSISGQLEVVDLPDKLADQWRDRLHADWLATLLPLADNDIEATVDEEMMLDGRPSIGISCFKKDRAAVRLYFDTQSYRLIKLTYQRGSDGTVFDDRFDDYIELEGLFYPRMRTAYFNGVKKMELRTTTLKFFDALPVATFTTP